MRSGNDESQLAKVQDEILSTAGLSIGKTPFDRQRREEGNQLTVGLSIGNTPFDRQRRTGNASSIAPLLQLPPPLQPKLQPQSGLTSEDRLAIMESMMKDVQSDIQEIRDSIRNVFRATDKISEDAQQASLRVDNLESEWRQWDDGWHNGYTTGAAIC